MENILILKACHRPLSHNSYMVVKKEEEKQENEKKVKDVNHVAKEEQDVKEEDVNEVY